MRALTAAEMQAELGCAPGVDGLPDRARVAGLIRRLLTGRTLDREALIGAVASLTSPREKSSQSSTARIRSVLVQMQMAGEVCHAAGVADLLCWLAPSVAVRSPDGRTLLLGQDWKVAAPGDAVDFYLSGPAAEVRTLSEYLGPPAFRFELKDLGAPGWRHASPEDLEAMMIAPPSQQPGPDRNLSASGRLWLETPAFASLVTTPHFESLPVQVQRALALVGTPLDDAMSAWALSPAAAAELDIWVGRPSSEDALDEHDDTADAGQQRVLEAPVASRLIVEAGPGSGKTRVACGRVARLIDDGASATRIFMISFTQAAVGELRARIGGFLASPDLAGDVQISTLDSIAGGFRSGFGQDGTASGFDAGIAEALALLKAGDRGLIGFLATLEHVVLDEAQDFTDDRRALVEALVRALPARCGVTLFEDPAQAIYGWKTQPIRSVSSTLLASPDLGFSRLMLEHDHRTRNPDLRLLKAQLRAALKPDADHDSAYTAVRGAIEAMAAPSSVLTPSGSTPRSTLVLFRGRGELLLAAARFWDGGFPVRVRLTRRTRSVAGWLGALVRHYQAPSLTREAFDILWRELWPHPAGLAADDAWRALRTVAGSGSQGAIDLQRLASRIDTPSPPLSLSRSATGRTGPVLSTIHGAKGQEAEHVVLALRREASRSSAIEARVLYVGATRARTTLCVAAAPSIFTEPVESKRVWCRWRQLHARVEIGIDGDVDVLRTAFWPDEDLALTEARQQALWALADTPVPVRAVAADGGWLLTAERGAFEGRDLGFLSAQVSKDLRNIGREHHGGARPGMTLTGLFLAGCQTVVHQAPGERAQFGLAPTIAGLARVYFNPPHAATSTGAAA